MVLKKKKKENKSEETESTGVKFGKVDIKAMKKAKAEEDSKSRRRLNRFKAPQGRSYVWILPPTSEAMNGKCYSMLLMHNNLGPEKSGYAQCVRNSLDEPREKCVLCKHVDGLWKKCNALKKNDKEKSKEYENEAKGCGVKQRPTVQVIDLSGSYNKAGQVVSEVPKCFGDNLGSDDEEGKHGKCRSCLFLNSCKLGVQTWDMQWGAYSFMQEKISEENIDICTPEAARPLKIVRKGTERDDTKYQIELADAIEIPQHLLEFAEKHATDLALLKKPSTNEQLMSIMNPDSEIVSEVRLEKKGKEGKKIKTKPVVSEDEKEMVRKKLMGNAAKKGKRKE